MKLILIILLIIFFVNNFFINLNLKSHFKTRELIVNEEGRTLNNSLTNSFYTVKTIKPTLTIFFDEQHEYSKKFYDYRQEYYLKDKYSPVSSTENPPECWNQIKQVYFDSYNAVPISNHPFLHNKMINLEEISCNTSNMEECVKNCVSKYDKNCGNIKYFENKSSEDGVNLELGEHIIQPPRDINLVTKLPFVMLTFQKFNGSDDNKKDIIDTEVHIYNGYYNFNDEQNKICKENIIDFLETTFHKHLLISKTPVDSAIATSYHQQQLKDRGSADTRVLLHTFDSTNQKITTEKKIYPNDILKCSICSEFVYFKSPQ